MMKFVFSAVLLSGFFTTCQAEATGTNWQQVPAQQAPAKEVMVFQPKKYVVYTFNEAVLKLQMFGLSTDPASGMIVDLPIPDGSFRKFRVWQCPMMDDAMSEKYPDIRTFSGEAVDNPTVTAKLDFTLYGFHAMIFDGGNTSFVDPYDNYHDGFYFAHYKTDEVRTINDMMKCGHSDELEAGPAGDPIDLIKESEPKLAYRTANGWNSRTYRLALSANHFYCQAATGLSTPTVAQSFSKMTTSMNRINGVYEKELSVHMNFCANEDTLIWNVNTGGPNGNDPFNSINSNPGSCLTKNQSVCDGRIGSANYDIGHVFTTGGGGVSLLGVVCYTGKKAQSVTGNSSPVGDSYDIDYVAHEMGHEFGSEHTFNNNNDGSCGGNAVSGTAYEPGSGSTIMAYASICSPDDLAFHSQDYFHASSLVQIYNKLAGSEGVCASTATTGNKLVSLASFTSGYTIPYKTPFELTSPIAVDSVADSITNYCWEEADLGDFGYRFSNTHLRGPIFRSYAPVLSPTRVFPRIGMVLVGSLSDAGIEGAQGEKAPDTARTLKFKLTVRNILHGYGCFLFPDDVITLTATQTPTRAGFKVTSQGTTGISYAGGSTQTITWDIVGTDAAPVNAANVDIYMSVDGGYTWPGFAGTFPNTGTANISVPNPATNTSLARFKVKGNGNVFFNVNGKNFTVSHTAGIPTLGIETVSTLVNDTKVFPVPAKDLMHITVGHYNNIQGVVINSLGQIVWHGMVNGSSDIDVSLWNAGVYHLRLTSNETSELSIRSFVVE